MEFYRKKLFYLLYSLALFAIIQEKGSEESIMDLRVLSYFLAITREQSIVHAAESLHLSQPTLSTQIKNLEEELGKQLFIRGTRGTRKVTLTEEGMILKKRAEEILDLVSRTEQEITMNDDIIVGDVYIGTGETDGVHLIAKAAHLLQNKYPGIRYHIASGNADFVFEQLEKGLIDFGLILGSLDLTKYNALELPYSDTWGVLMRRDSPLAHREFITPEDLRSQPLILSQQEARGGTLTQWLGCAPEKMNIIATYNLIFNSSLFVNEGLGYAVILDKILNTSGDDRLCFRPLMPKLEIKLTLVWKKYQIFSKPAGKFLEVLKESLSQKSPGI